MQMVGNYWLSLVTSFKRSWVVLVIIIWLVYGKTLSYGLSYFDDNLLVTERAAFLSQSDSVLTSFKQHVFHGSDLLPMYYRPFLTLSFIFDAQLGSMELWVFRATNIGLHMLTVGLLHLWLRIFKVTNHWNFILCMIFAVHPALLHTVAWIPGRNDSLLAVGLLSSFYFFHRWLMSNKLVYLWLHWVGLGVSLFTKESALLLPFLIGIYVYLFAEDKKAIVGKKVLPGWIVIIGGWILLRQSVFSGLMVPSFSDRLAELPANLPSIGMYVSKLFFPGYLSVVPVMADFPVVLTGLGFVLLGLLLWLSFRINRKVAIFGIFWFAGFFLPSLIPGDVNQQTHMVLEHRAYVPVMGLLLLVGLFLKKILFKVSTHGVWVAGLILVLMYVSYSRLDVYADSFTFWQSAVRDSPNSSVAYNNLGVIYAQANDPEKAIINYQKSLALYPRQAGAWGNLGAAYNDAGKYSLAKEALIRELETSPSYTVYFNYGVALNELEEPQEAEIAWLKALELNPDYDLGYVVLTQLYYMYQDYDKAKAYYDVAKSMGASFIPEIENKLGD